MSRISIFENRLIPSFSKISFSIFDLNTALVFGNNFICFLFNITCIFQTNLVKFYIFNLFIIFLLSFPINLFFYLLLSFFSSLIFLRIYIYYANKKKLFAFFNFRSSHSNLIPTGSGIVFSFISVFFFISPSPAFLNHPASARWHSAGRCGASLFYF